MDEESALFSISFRDRGGWGVIVADKLDTGST